MEFDVTPRFWHLRVALDAWTDFAFCSDENLLSNFRKSKREVKKEKEIKISLSHALLTPSVRLPFLLTFMLFIFFFLSIYYYYYYYYFEYMVHIASFGSVSTAKQFISFQFTLF